MDPRAPVGGVSPKDLQRVRQAGLVDGIRHHHADVVPECLEIGAVVDPRREHETGDADFGVVLLEQASDRGCLERARGRGAIEGQRTRFGFEGYGLKINVFAMHHPPPCGSSECGHRGPALRRVYPHRPAGDNAGG